MESAIRWYWNASATNFKYHQWSQIIKDTVEPSFLSAKLI